MKGATPIVPVHKQDGTFRICGDFNVTVNPAEKYPQLKIEDTFANFVGGQNFSKLDVRQAYHQIEIDTEFKRYFVINTHIGVIQYNGLVLGISSASVIWQRTMDQVLAGISGTGCILDDMIVTRKDDETHLANLQEVLQRLQSHGLRASKAKCAYFKETTTFCGHGIDHQRLYKTTEKIDAVVNAPRLQSVTDVRFFSDWFIITTNSFPILPQWFIPSTVCWNTITDENGLNCVNKHSTKSSSSDDHFKFGFKPLRPNPSTTVSI